MRRLQQGMTMWGLAVIVALIVFFSLLTLQLLPPYLEYFKIRTVMENLARQPDFGSMTREQMVESLQKRFDIEHVERVDLRSDLRIEPRGRMKVVTIEYQVVVPLAYNISALLDFKKSVEAQGGE